MRKANYIISNLVAIAVILLGLTACSKSDTIDDSGITVGGIINKQYSATRSKVLTIEPSEKQDFTNKYSWSINDSLVSEEFALDFIAVDLKNYPVYLKITSPSGSVRRFSTTVTVSKEAVPYSRYISQVLDFQPAPGQFINDLPEYKTGDTKENLIKKANSSIKGSTNEVISLGSYGGFVVFRFDHTVMNKAGRDFKILGNAFWGDQAIEARAGSCEPGIIMVAYDRNKNGKPDDDEWYEIAGSEYFKPETIKNYSMTYYKPEENKPGVLYPNLFWATDIEYIKWTDNQGSGGFKTKNIYHDQSYYPYWITENSISFQGTKLANNFYDQSGTGNYWVGRSYAFGYADNAPNTDEASNIDISWAVDKSGRYVKLPGIDFVKVYTGVNQEAGWLGEVSTEVGGAYDLHIK